MDKILDFLYEQSEYEYNSNSYYYYNDYKNNIPLDIKDYDYFFDSRMILPNSYSEGQLSIEFYSDSEILKLYDNGNEIYSKKS